MSSDLFAQIILFISYSIDRLTGSDGFPVLCHQFAPSSKYPLLPSLRSFNKSSQGLLSRPWLRNNADQAQKTFPTASQKMSGRQSFSEFLKTTNPPAR